MATKSKSLGSKIRTARQALGKTQLQLAHEMGYEGANAGAYICRIEKNLLMPRLPVLQRMAKVLELALAELVG